MRWLFRLFSGSHSVQTEVLKRLPQSIQFEFRAEFDAQNNPVIFAHAPAYEGLMTEGIDFDETVHNACDAILTYFDVPSDYANLVEYEVAKVEEQNSMLRDDPELSLKHIVLNRHTLSHA